MEISDFLRNALVHIRGIIVGAILAGLAVAGALVLASQPYSATSTLRVIQPTGALDATLLPTAVEWYAALDQVPGIVSAAAGRAQPPVASETLQAQSSLSPGSGPGEIIVTVSGSDADEALSSNTALSEVLVEQVEKDPTLQFGETRLSVLVPAGVNGRLGFGVAAAFLTSALAAFLLLFTAAGLLHRQFNWRVNKRVLKALGPELGLEAFCDPEELAVVLVSRCREHAQTWMAAGADVTPETFASLAGEVSTLGGSVTIEPIPDTARDAPPGPGIVYLPEPNDGSPLAVSAANRASAPTLILVSKKCRARVVRSLVERLRAVGVEVWAIAPASST